MELQFVWGWQPALYLFLGGLGAGAFVVAACLFLFGKDDRRRALGVVSWAAFACLVVGLLLLVSELIFPLRGLMMWQSFSNLTSWMTIGAWLLFVAVIFILVTAVALTEPLAQRLKLDGNETLLKVCFGVGGVLSLGVAVYTGILLMNAPGVPLWNTLWLPVLFTVSALDTGVALNEIVFCVVEKRPVPRLHRVLVVSTIVLVVVEAVVVAAFVGAMAAGGGYAMESYALAAAASAEVLVEGQLSGWFWAAFVGLGLVVPLVCAVVALVRERGAKGKGARGAVAAEAVAAEAPTAEGADGAESEVAVAVVAESEPEHGEDRTLTWVSALSVLIGGCTLRFIVLLAGVHADVLAIEVAKLVL